QTLGSDENTVGECPSQSSLREPIVANPRDDRKHCPPGKNSEKPATDEHHEELFEPGADFELARSADHAEQDGEQRDSRSVIEQGFAFDEPGQARRRSYVAADR